jgi:hypothetical protein
MKAKISFKKSFSRRMLAKFEFLRKYLTLVSLVAFLVFSATGGAYAQEAHGIEDLDEGYEVPASDSLFTPASYLTDDVASWKPSRGDKLEINVETNMARLVHTDGESLSFEIVSGQRRVVRYIGRRYFAATPAAEWVARETVIKRDRWTFGKSGRFIRLYRVSGEGENLTEEFTPYGIHPFGREDAMFRVAGRYGSMGCVIMREKMVDIIQKTIQVNSGELSVRTFPVMPEA